MGKATIKTDYGDGKYLVEIPMQQGYTNNLLARLNQRILYLQTQITLAEVDLDELNTDLFVIEGQTATDIASAKALIAAYEKNVEDYTRELTVLNNELAALKLVEPKDQVAIAAKKVEIEAKKEEIKAENTKIDKKKAELAALQAKVDAAKLAIDIKEEQIAYMKAELLSTQKRYAYVREFGIINNYDVVAWCCDLTEGLSGTVTILEITTDIDKGVNIFPAYKDGAGLPGYSLSTMGEFLPFATLPVADALRNFCAMPAIQKWAPTFRYGTLNTIDYETNTCSVGLQHIRSRIQNIAIDQTPTLYSVPIEYMFCDAAAFEVGDEVVVEFTDHDWAQPKVIGFKSNPQPCGWEEPWDGPNIQWKYDWVYSGGTYAGSGTLATRTITNGVMTMSYPDTDSGSGALGQYHYLQLHNYGEALTENVNSIKIDVASTVDCYTGVAVTHDYQLVVVGWDLTETTLLNYVCRFVYTGYWPHIGCEGFDYDETAFSQTSSGNASVWWLPGGPYPYETYTRLISNDKEEFFEVTKAMSKVLAVGLEMNSNWVGGAAYNVPDVITGGSLACDLIGLA